MAPTGIDVDLVAVRGLAGMRGEQHRFLVVVDIIGGNDLCPLAGSPHGRVLQR